MSKPCFTVNQGKVLNEPGPLEQPYAAQAQEVMDHEAYRDPKHPEHLRYVRWARQLLTAAHGTLGEIKAEINRPLDGREKLHGLGIEPEEAA